MGHVGHAGQLFSDKFTNEVFGLSSLTLGTTVVIILFYSILWKKKYYNRLTRIKRNVINLNQTVALRVWILADYCAAQIILMAIPQDKVVVFEMYKLIFVDNILYRFLVPFIFIFYTKKTLPELWSDKSLKKVDFYLSRQIIVPRRPV